VKTATRPRRRPRHSALCRFSIIPAKGKKRGGEKGGKVSKIALSCAFIDYGGGKKRRVGGCDQAKPDYASVFRFEGKGRARAGRADASHNDLSGPYWCSFTFRLLPKGGEKEKKVEGQQDPHELNLRDKFTVVPSSALYFQKKKKKKEKEKISEGSRPWACSFSTSSPNKKKRGMTHCQSYSPIPHSDKKRREKEKENDTVRRCCARVRS